MKKVLFFTAGLFPMVIFGQHEGKIGINTEKPNATLDVKAKTNNGSKVLELQNSQATKLVSVLDNGNLGIGEVEPTEKLHINGKIRIVDGTQGEGKILISDANGIAKWGDNNGSNIETNSLVKRAKGVTIDCTNIDHYLFFGVATFYCENDILYVEGTYRDNNGTLYLSRSSVSGNKIIIPSDTSETIKFNYSNNDNNYFYTQNRVLYVGE